MRKLLSANFSRLRRDKMFWICLAAVLLLSVVSTLEEFREVFLPYGDDSCILDDSYYLIAPLIFLFIVIFTSLFMRAEYSDGMVRNKIIVGHSRRGIYLANFTVCFSASLAFTAAWSIGVLIGIPIFSTNKLDLNCLAKYILIAVFLAAALTGIMVLISTVSTNKSLTAVGGILIFFVLLIFAIWVYNFLSEPEIICDMCMTADGTIEMSNPESNLLYISGLERTVYEWILYILPMGQWLIMANHEIFHPIRQLVGSSLVTFCTTFCGILTFRRKNLK